MRRVDGLSEGIIFLSPRRIPTRRVETRQRLAAAGSEEFAMIDLISEKDRRLRIWHSISNEDLDNFEPKQLRNLGIYGGAQGIWVDKTHTAGPEIGSDGATVAILHTGHHYPDDLSDDGVIYPKTSRPLARDAAEIQATKNAMILRLPIFVVLPGKKSPSRRCLKLGHISIVTPTTQLTSVTVLSSFSSPAKAPCMRSVA